MATTEQATAKITVTGAEAPNPIQFLERGVAIPFKPADDVPELRTRQQANKVYQKMLRGDSQTRTTIRACTIPILGADWFIEPGGEEQDDDDAAMWVHYNLFTGMSITWTRVLEHVVKFMPYGHSAMEKVYEERDWRPNAPNRNTRRYLALRKLMPLPSPSIKEFQYDTHGGPRGLVQTIYDPSDPKRIKFEDVDIPIEKLILFTFDQDGGNLEGNSLIRTAYKHWYYKENFYKIDGVQKERHGIGVPYAKLPPGYNEKDLDFAAEMLSNIRVNERSYLMEPPGWEFGFKEVPGQQVDALESAQHHDIMIARNVLVQFINMGQGQGAGGASGARATSGTMLDMFLKSLRHVANLIADYFNTYLIPQLVGYNFEVDTLPTLKIRGIGERRDLQMFAAALNNIKDYLTIDDETERWLREEFDMPVSFDTSVDRGVQSSGGLFGNDDAGRPPTGRIGKSPSSGE